MPGIRIPWPLLAYGTSKAMEIMKIKIPTPKFKVGDKIIVDGFEDATVAEVGAFKKNDKVTISYKLKDNVLPGFWAEEGRIKKNV